MIVNTLMSLGISVVRFIFGLIEAVSIPSDLVSVLYSIMCYGTWVVGSDVLLLCTGSIMSWITVRLSSGIAVWAWQQVSAIT